MTAFLFGLAIGAGSFAIVANFLSMPEGKIAWLDKLRARFK